MEYDFGVYSGRAENLKIKLFIDDFVEKGFGLDNVDLDKIIFKPQDDSGFDANVAAYYCSSEKAIILRYEDWTDFTKIGPLQIHVLVHEIQHSVNNKKFLGLINAIERSKCKIIIKTGLEKVYDEYLAEYTACKSVEGASINSIDGLIQISKDIKNKSKSPLDLYIECINVIPQAIGEMRSIFEQTGEEVLEKVCGEFYDSEFEKIVKDFDDVMKNVDNLEMLLYLEKCGLVLMSLIDYLEIDSETRSL